MPPSQTVEDYLKALFLAQTALPGPTALVPMGQLAAALGVVPGTATTMVKALAESGLVRYEPYVGVRLSSAGQKLAALVLRRHRLIELFLVQVMGMNWTEVHEEAEHLEHAVSDRLIERMDEMLGHPSVDPHGDPIPGPEGTVSRLEYDTLLTCPLHARVTVRRVSDQDSEFLKFAERHDLKPGQVVQVESRDSAGDSVLLRGGHDREFTIGTRAASKVLVQVARLVVFLILLTGTARAQNAVPDPRSEEPFGIADNSFLVEEAFNQEAGIFQNIFGAMRVGGAWSATFTQEWPVPSQRHQLSYTLAFLDGGTGTGVGDTLVNYRYQVMLEGRGRPAFAPRASLVLPTGSATRGRGAGSAGLQVNLPFSKRTHGWYFHWNGGFTWLPSADAPSGFPDDRGQHANLVSPFGAASAIYRLTPMLHPMLETVVVSQEEVTETTTTRETFFTLSPGVRGGWNIGNRQLIAGAAVPITWGGSDTETGVFLYLSYELPFRKP
jgi:DtxR family Mn-dependent transcriptional regulator